MRGRERGRHNKQEVNLIFGLAGRGPRFKVMGKQPNGHSGGPPLEWKFSRAESVMKRIGVPVASLGYEAVVLPPIILLLVQ